MSVPTGSVLLCPQCGAPARPPSRFATQTTCTFCAAVITIDPSVVRAQAYRDALARWGASDAATVQLDKGAWRLVRPLARGKRTDLWHVERTRTPTERGILKLSRGGGSTQEGAVLAALAATGANAVGTLLPSLVASGPVLAGAHAGKHAVVVRAAPTFTHDLATIGAAYPRGIDPAIIVWMWRRLLETLRILVEIGATHDAIEPAHLVVEENQHGLRLVGFGNSRMTGEGAGAAVATSARMLRGLSAAPPTRLEDLLRRVADDPTIGRTAPGILDLHRAVGELASAEFGPPRFRPLTLPS